MKRSLAIFASALTAGLLFTGCGNGADAGNTTSSETSSAPTSTAPDGKQSFLDVMSLTCGPRSLEESYPSDPARGGYWESAVQLAGTMTVETLEEAWKLEPAQREYCVAPLRGGKITSSDHTVTLQALEVGSAQKSTWLASWDRDDPDELQNALYRLYGQCASYNAQVETEGTRFIAEQAEFLLEDLCPNHPEKQQVLALVKENGKYWDGVKKELAGEAEAKAKEREEKEKKQAEIDSETIESGSYLIGSDVKPGTYKATTKESFDNCYWEVKDSDGDILSNEWLTEGKSVIAVIPKSGHTFKTTGCGNFIKH